MKTAASDGTGRLTGVRLAVLVATALVLGVCLALSLLLGSGSLGIATVVEHLRHPDSSYASYVVVTLRGTRTLVGLLVGAALGVAGAAMQAITRNPMADPGLLGVNAGAALAIVLGAEAGIADGYGAQFALAAVGAVATAVLVYAIGAGGGRGRLILAGVAVSACAAGVIRALVLLSPQTLDAYRFWDVGALTRMDVPLWALALPVALGLVLVGACANRLTSLALGDDVARGLGINVARTRAAALVGLTLLCAAATAVAGPISFVGLVVPVAGYQLMGAHRGWIVAFCALGGPALVLAADVLGRLVARPQELQVGVLTAFVGAPVLIWMVLGMRRVNA